MSAPKPDACTYPLTLRPGVVVHACSAKWMQPINRDGAK